MVLQINKKENIQNLLGMQKVGPQQPVVDTRPFPARVPGTAPVANYQPFQPASKVAVRPPSSVNATITIPNKQAGFNAGMNEQVKKAYEASLLGMGANFIADTAKNFVKAPVRIGNTITEIATGQEGNVAGVGGVKGYGSETLRGFGIDNPDPVASSIVGGLLTAADLTPLAGMGLSKVGKETAMGARGVSTAVRDAQKAIQVTKQDKKIASQLNENPDITTTVTPEGVAKARVTNEQNAAYQAAQNAQQAKYNQNPVINAAKVVQRELADPRAVQQRSDNRWFSYQKKQGLTKKGQTELLPKDSLAHQRGIAENPGKPAAVRADISYSGSGDTLNSINKFYGNSEKPKARDFENYRIFKDELENLSNGRPNTLGLDPNAMAKYVSDYERANPLAIRHNAELRANQLAAFKDRTAAGVDNPEVFNATAGRQFYNPRQAVDPEELVKMKMSGGASSSPKGTKLRSETAGGPVRSPLDLFYKSNMQTEKALAQQRYGQIIRERTAAGQLKGAKEVVNAETTIRHKSLMKDLEDLRNTIKAAKKERDAIASAKRKVTKKSNTAKASSKQAAAKQANVKRRNALLMEKKARDAEKKVIADTRKMIKNAKGKPEDRLNDLADRDPRYNTELDKLKKDNAKLTQLTTEERRAQFKFDKAQLDKKYPKPTSYTDDEVLQIARALGEDTSVTLPKGASDALAGATTKRRVATRLSNKLQKEVDSIKASLQDSRDYIKGVEASKSETFGDFVDSTQYQQRGTQTVEYKVDGEVGKIEIPADLAKELEAANKAANESLLEKGLQGVANLQKVTWTGAFAPVFKVWNVLIKNPVLALFNGDRLSAVGVNAIGAFFRASVGTPAMRALKKEMLKGGASFENALQSRNITSTVANDIAARANLVSFFKRNPVNTFQDLWKGLNNALSHFDNAQRVAVGYGAKKRALRLGFSEEDATNIAAGAPAKVFGDFDRISRLARNMEVLYPYSGATQAGARAMGHAWRTKPVETGIKFAALATTVGAFTAYGLSNNEEYYQDMIDQKKEYILDSNVTIVLPGATKDDKGNWSGIIQIPLVPDLRPMNRAVWRSVHSAANGQGVDVGMISAELFNQFTGDAASSIYDVGATNNGKNPLNGVFAGSPATTSIKISSGVNPRTGDPLETDYQRSLGKDKLDQRVNTNTSDAALSISKFIGGALSPIQVDAYLGQLGNLGKGIQAKQNADGTQSTFLDNFFNFTKPFQPGTSQTVSKKESAEYYKNLMEVLAPLNENEQNAFASLHPKGKDGTDEQVYVSDSTYNPAARLDIYNRFPKVFQADKQMNDRAAAQGGPSNPLFALTPEQVKKVLERDNLPPGAKDPELSTLYDKDWYVQYSTDKSRFFDDIKVSQQKSLEQAKKEGDEKKVSSIESSMAKFDSPDNPYPKTDPNLQKVMDYYSSLPKGTGARSSWIKSNPVAWKAMQDNFAAIDNWQNNQRVKRGLDTTEGQAGKDKGYGTLTLSNDSSNSGSGNSGDPTANAYKYAVSLGAGGKVAGAIKPSKVGAASMKNKKVAVKSKPKVSVRKSLV